MPGVMISLGQTFPNTDQILLASCVAARRQASKYQPHAGGHDISWSKLSKHCPNLASLCFVDDGKGEPATS